MVDYSKLFISVLDLSSKADSDMRGFYILALNQFAVQGLTIYSENIIMKWRSDERETWSSRNI